ncbi:MAG: hypothetical protein NTX49_10225 [Chlamydiae bacterium]|nr:hypothetical protein [Chlamydiota bacterium]
MTAGINNASLPNRNQNVSCLQGCRNWGQNNPTTVKILGVVGLILGIALVVSSSVALPAGIVMAGSLYIAGAISIIASSVLLASSLGTFPQIGNLSSGNLYTTFQDVRARPDYYLALVTRSDSAFPTRVTLANNPRTLDLGGVTKEFITKLMKYLAESPSIALSETGFPRQINEQTRATYQKLGMFYSILDKQNTSRMRDNFVTGTLFHAGFFQILQKVALQETVEELRKEATRQISAASGQAWSPLILEPENRRALEAYAAALGQTTEEALTSTHEQVDEFINAAKSFYNGTTAAFKEKIRLTDPAVLAREIQGEPISKEGLIAALMNVCYPDAQCFEWIKEKIRVSDQEWRTMFVSVITGNGALTPGTKIRIQYTSEHHTPGTFEIHTCFNSLAVPRGLENGLFLQSLDAVLVDGYNIA